MFNNRTGTNYVYDLNGNMIFDKSKNMAIEYDWRDMPVTFYFFPTITSTITTWQNVEDLIAGLTYTTKVAMMYDAGGNRVKKKLSIMRSHHHRQQQRHVLILHRARQVCL